MSPSAETVAFQNGFEMAFRNERETVLIPPHRYLGPSGLNVFPVKPSYVLDKPTRYVGELPNDVLPLSESKPDYQKWGI